jgi:hypothetical protein
MAKKHAPDHKPYSPVDVALMQSLPTVFSPGTAAEEPATAPVQEVEAEFPKTLPEAIEDADEEEDVPPPKVVRMPLPEREPTLPSVDQPRFEQQRLEQPKSEPATSERLTKQLKFQVSHPERLEIMRVVHRFAGELETSLDWSHVARALTMILRHAEKELLQQARRNGPMPRPRNDRALALAEFETQIARILLRAFRDTGPLH